MRSKLKSFGRHSSALIGCEVRKGSQIEIGSNTVINQGVLLDGRGGLNIGNNVNISDHVKIWTLEHDMNDSEFKDKAGTMVIKDYVWIASSAILLPGITINRGAVVGAGSVVTEDVAEFTFVAGNPAVEKGKRNKDLSYNLNYKPWFR